MPLAGKKHTFFGRTVEGKQILLSSIDSIGRENGNADSNYAVQNWSLPSVTKRFSPVNNRYGTAGYYQIRPTSEDAPNISNEPAPLNNDLGISAGISPTLYSKPSFANIVGGAGDFVNFFGYPTFRGNDEVTIYRQGALSVPVNNGPFNSPTGPNASYFGIIAQITLTQYKRFLLGVATDTVSSGTFAPRYIGVFSAIVGGTVFSASMPRNGVPKMPFFIIQGIPGETFIVAAWQDTAVRSNAAASLITFDTE